MIIHTDIRTYHIFHTFTYCFCNLFRNEAKVLNKASLAFKNKVVSALGVKRGKEIELELRDLLRSLLSSTPINAYVPTSSKTSSEEVFFFDKDSNEANCISQVIMSLTITPNCNSYILCIRLSTIP